MAKPPKEERAWNSTLPRRKKWMEPKKAELKRTQWMRSKSPKDRSGFIPKPRAGLKPMSKKREKALRGYYPAQNAFLKRPENRFCYLCIGRSIRANRWEILEMMLLPVDKGDALLRNSGASLRRATEVHHRNGRIGRLLSFTPLFIPSCLDCREWPHMCAKDARALDLLAPSVEYNVFPENALEVLAEYEKKITSFQTK